jgi:hypothetical protein
MLGTTTSMANEIEHNVEVNLKPTIVGNEPLMYHPSHNTSFIDLCNSDDNNGVLLNFSYHSMYFHVIHLGKLHEVFGSIPYLSSINTSFVMSVVDYFWAISWVLHYIYEL